MKIIISRKYIPYLVIGIITLIISMALLITNQIYFKNEAFLWISIALMITSIILILITSIKDRFNQRKINSRRKA